MAQFYSWDWWVEKMKYFCKENNLSYTFNSTPTKTYYEDYYVTFYFNDKVSASQFAVVWADHDWGLAHHPV